MDMYTAAMGNAYRSSPGVFGRLDYHPQAERQTQKRRHQQPQQQQTTVTPGQQAHLTPEKQNSMGQFGILAPTPVPLPQHQPMTPMGQQTMSFGQESPAVPTSGKLPGKIVVDPPDLETWREKLFNVDEMIVLTHEQYVPRVFSPRNRAEKLT